MHSLPCRGLKEMETNLWVYGRLARIIYADFGPFLVNLSHSEHVEPALLAV